MFTNRTKTWILGISIILAAVATAFVAFFDNDPNTEVNVPQTIEEIHEGITVITNEVEEVK